MSTKLRRKFYTRTWFPSTILQFTILWMCSLYVSLRYLRGLWFHKMEHWHQTIKRFFFAFFYIPRRLHSTMQQMLLNESTILGIFFPCFAPLSNPRVVFSCLRFVWLERALQFLRIPLGGICAECDYWMYYQGIVFVFCGVLSNVKGLGAVEKPGHTFGILSSSWRWFA